MTRTLLNTISQGKRIVRVKLQLFFSYYLLFVVLCRVTGAAVIASTIRAFRAVQTDGSLLDELKPCGIVQDNTESYDICSPAQRG